MSLGGKFSLAHEDGSSNICPILSMQSRENERRKSDSLSCILLTSGFDGQVKAWDVELKQDCIATIDFSSKLSTPFQPQHPLGIIKMISIMFNENEYLATNSMEGLNINIYSLNKKHQFGKLLCNIPCSPSYCWAMAWISTGYLALAAGNGSIQIYGIALVLDSGNVQKISTKTIALGCKFIHDMHCREDGSILAAGTENGSIYLVNPNDGQVIKTLSEHVKPVRKVLFSSNGKWLYSAGDDLKINAYLYDNETFSLEFSLTGHMGWIMTLALSNDDIGLLASGSVDGQIKIWDIQRKTCLYTLTDHLDQVLSLYFLDAVDNENNWLASVGGDKNIYIHFIHPQKRFQQ